MQQRFSSLRLSDDINYRLFVPLFVHALATQTLASMLRVTTTYRAIELGLSEIWLGAISSAFALLPVFIAVRIGRYVDRGHDARSVWIGSWLILLACAGFRGVQTTGPLLLLFTAVFGVGYLFLMIAHQMISVRCSNERSRETVFGNYMVANALGQGMGPLIVGWLGGAAQLPPTRLLFGLAATTAVAMVVISVAIRPAPAGRASDVSEPSPPVSKLLAMPSMATLIMASVITVTAQDLMVIYLPLVGTERSIDVATIGFLLMVRAATAMLARIFYSRMIQAAGRLPLTVMTMLVSSLAYILIALPLPMPALYFAVVVIGFALGIAATLSISNVIDIAPTSARGVALSLRITGNRLGQVVLPTLAGMIAAATGAAGIFWCISASLVISGLSVDAVRKSRAAAAAE